MTANGVSPSPGLTLLATPLPRGRGHEHHHNHPYRHRQVRALRAAWLLSALFWSALAVLEGVNHGLVAALFAIGLDRKSVV